MNVFYYFKYYTEYETCILVTPGTTWKPQGNFVIIIVMIVKNMPDTHEITNMQTPAVFAIPYNKYKV